MTRTYLRGLWIFIFLLAAALWSVHIGRPVDLPFWHEFDYSSIARNFLREGNNILYPRIDWRGDGPGFTEMEFPIIPWVMAQLYRVFGLHEVIGRLLSYTAMLASLFVFSRLAIKLLPETAALAAALFFVVNHEVVAVATAILPESWMLLFYLMAAYCFVTWYESKSWGFYFLAIVSFACAMLVKSPSAHLAIFFFLWALYKDGPRALLRPALYLFALLSFAPMIWWYAHAAGLWHQFHNSMGVSNEDHWIGLDILRRPKVIANLVSIDAILVCAVGGTLVIFIAWWKDRLTSAANRLALYWCVAIAIYLLVIIRTAGAYWAAYYHVIAVPPLALLFGAGVSKLQKSGSPSLVRLCLWCGAASCLLVAALLVGRQRDLTHLPGVFQDLLAGRSSIMTLAVLSVLSLALTVLCARLGDRSASVNERHSALLIIGCFTYFFISGQLLLGAWKGFATPTPQFGCTACFQDKLAVGALIAVSGGVCSDAAGHRTANDAPNMFYWLDRKGFTTCYGQESIAQLKGFMKRGAAYFIADKASIQEQPGLEAQLRTTFALLGECQTAWLFQLQPSQK